MAEMNIGVVITVGPGRGENVELTLDYLARSSVLPHKAVLVLDGPDVEQINWPEAPFPISAVRTAHKHQPGMEQPRNIGVRHLGPEITHAWFLDSDILVEPDTLHHFEQAYWRHAEHNPILIGPYELSMPEGMREPHPELFIDMRWAMFQERGEGPFVAELGVALGCFGGNLIWPVNEFTRVGGFHPQLNHGRCEDGELGLRAASHRIPMVLVATARGYHVAHAINYDLAVQRNERDVPLLNQWHPWVEGEGIVLTDMEGARFEFVCQCGQQVNTLEMWAHQSVCPAVPGEGQSWLDMYAAKRDAESELILPDALRDA